MPKTSEHAATATGLSLQAQLQRDLLTIRKVAAKVENMLATDNQDDQPNHRKEKP